MSNTDVELQKLRGEVEKVNLKLDNFIKSNDGVTAQIVVNARQIEKKLDAVDFQEYRDETKPLLDWASSRISQERLIFAVVGFIGFSNLLLIIYIFLNSPIIRGLGA